VNRPGAIQSNLRIKPRKRLVRDKPEALTVPEGINQVWSMNFMHDQLEDGRTFLLFIVIDNFNRRGAFQQDGSIRVVVTIPLERLGTGSRLCYPMDVVLQP